MTAAFEVLEKDIEGRVGKLKIGDKTIRTPALLPVINPHFQVIPPKMMASWGVEAIITNAYIFSRSEEYREKTLIKGLHDVLDFPGVIMTDSGSFQLSVYGDVEVTNAMTLSFQEKIGSDIIVPLDIPTSPDAEYNVAENDLEITLSRIKEGISILPDSATLAAPVQGGRFLDLRKKAAENVDSLDLTICPIGAVVPLMESYRYLDLVSIVKAAKSGLSQSRCVHLFGAGHPAMFALAVAMGCDLFDSAAYALYAKDGRYLTPHGSYHLADLREFICPCRVCSSHTPDELLKSADKEKLLAEHNLLVTIAEIKRVRQAVTDGVLWELLDERCRSHPSLLSAYREFIKTDKSIYKSEAVSKRRFFYKGSEHCARSEVIRYHSMLERFSIDEKVLITFDKKGDRDDGSVFFFKPPFGPYPPELRETFPIGQSEIPTWDEDMVRTGAKGLKILIQNNPDSKFTIRCDGNWKTMIEEEISPYRANYEII